MNDNIWVKRQIERQIDIISFCIFVIKPITLYILYTFAVALGNYYVYEKPCNRNRKYEKGISIEYIVTVSLMYYNTYTRLKCLNPYIIMGDINADHFFFLS